MMGDNPKVKNITLEIRAFDKDGNLKEERIYKNGKEVKKDDSC